MDEERDTRQAWTPPYTPGWPYGASMSADEECPCGSGRSNASCHGITALFTLQRAQRGATRPRIDTRGRVLSSEPGRYSSGIATACHGCGAVLTVGLAVQRAEDLVLRCGCGADCEVSVERP